MSFEKPNFNKKESETKTEPIIPKKDVDLSRREFIKKVLAFGTVATLAPEVLSKEVDSVESNEKMIDINLPHSGGRVSLTASDIDKLSRLSEISIKRTVDSMEGDFTELLSEEQNLIIGILGDKLKQATLEVQNRGFDFSANDTFHAHFFVDSSEYVSKIMDYTGKDPGDSLMSRKEFNKKLFDNIDGVSEMLKMVRGLVIHCAEFPSRSELIDQDYWLKREYRNVVVDDAGLQSVFSSKEKEIESEKISTKGLGLSENPSYPSQGFIVEEYNLLNNKKYEDLALSGVILKFKIDEENGVKLDPGLPKLRFVLSK